MNKKIFFLIIVLIIIGLPIWQVKTNSRDLVDGVVKNLSTLGAWNYQNFSIESNGVITVKELQFTPKGHQQGFSIELLKLNAGLKPLLLNYGGSLQRFLPKQLSLNFYGIKMNHKGDDLQQSIGERNFWPLAASDLGAFGCGDDELRFSVEQWQQLLPQEHQHDIDFSYSVNPKDGYQMAFDLSLRTEQTWSLGWSGVLSRGSDDKNIDFADVSVTKLHYDHLDQGFNKRRNELCADKYQGSFEAYRLAAAGRLQRHLRTYATQEMSEDLENRYQRTLMENAEVGLLFAFSKAKFFSELAEISRLEWFSESSVEAALGEDALQPIALKPIDHLDLNMDLLKEQMQVKQQLEEQKNQAPEPKEELLKTVVRKTGSGKPQTSLTIVNDWQTAIDKRVTIKTKKGKPLSGVLLDVNQQYLSIRTHYAQGQATLNIDRKDVLSITLKK